ncbi:uncharacterized protein LOC111056165 isoform X1 [Nilaparvata lugens]|uniref:uncharacterized protein LOC111056165 isoform X1 n=1 Tax=Nilaparvata lugens TaxID=108931 RepID=UPI00193E3223|nr:uncharacterized protein LOC111056165 isoform X1 [Nilaparvata lugens]
MSVLSVIAPIIYYLCSLSGVITRRDDDVLGEKEPSLCYQVTRFFFCLTFNLLILIITEFIVYLNFYISFRENTTDVKNVNMMYFMSDAFLHNSKIVFIVISSLTSFWRWREYYSLINKLAVIRSSLMFTTKYRGKVFFFLMYVFVLLTFFCSRMRVGYLSTIITNCLVIPNIIIQITLIQFIYTFYEINMILMNALMKINMNLEEIHAKIKNDNLNDINLLVDGQCDLQLVDSLRNLSEELRSAMELTNHIFGLQILAATFDLFLNIVITPYFLYIDIKTTSSSGHVFMMTKEGKVFWTIANILKLVFLFLPCASTTDEAAK